MAERPRMRLPFLHGFSLVELSIVLVILGLLTGGILAGQSLIRASELRSVGTEHARWVTATRAFRDKYFALPGDITNATMIWGKDAVLCNGSSGTASTPGTCNGNGDGQVSTFTTEQYRYWQHMVLAGLIEGNYTGVTGPGSSIDHVLGTNVPASKVALAGWQINDYWNTGGDGAQPIIGSGAFQAGNYFIFGGDAGAGYTLSTAVLKPAEAWNIDTKLDDGLPARGKVIARIVGNMCVNASGGTPAQSNLDSQYTVSLNETWCAINFVRQF